MIEDIYRDDVMNDNSIRKNLVEEFTDHYSISRAQMLNLYAQINEFRSKYSLKEYYEDHSVIEALESSEVTNLHQMLDFLKHKVSEKDIGLASTTAKVSANSLLNLKVRADLEKSYSEVIRQMLSTTDRETFGYSDHNNIAISTFYTENEINIDIVLSKTIFSVDNITRGNGCITIAGSLNDENYSLIALIIRDHRYEAVISPNQMSFDFYNRIYYIKFEERIYSKLKNARLLFYVKRGKNTVKYGLGSSLSHQDVTKMLNILILAYEMPLIFTDSIRHRKNNFLASAQKENINLNSKPYSVTDMRNLANSPKFNLFRGHRRSSSLTKDNRMATTKKTSRTPDLFSNASRWVFRSKQKNGNLFDCSNGKINPEDEIMKSNSGRKKFKIPSVRHTPNKQNTFFINIENPIPSPMINEASEQKLMAVSESARNKLNNLLLFESDRKEIEQQPVIDQDEYKISFRNTEAKLPLTETHLQETEPKVFQKESEEIIIQKVAFKTPEGSNLKSILTTTKKEVDMKSIPESNQLISKSKKVEQSSRKKVILPPKELISLPPTLNPVNKKEIEGQKSATKLPSTQHINLNDQMYIPISNSAPKTNFIPKQEFLNPLLFKDEFFASVKNQLDILEKTLPGEPFEKSQKLMVLYYAKDLYDAVLKFKDEEIQAHKIALIQCPYFHKFINTNSNRDAVICMPPSFSPQIFKKILRSLYYSRLEHAELETMEAEEAKEMLYQAYELKLVHLMKSLVVRVLIPKMEKSICLELIAESQGKKEGKPIWDALRKYCISYFSVHSKSILTKYSKQLSQIEHSVIIKMTVKALYRCKDIDHMYQLLAVLVESGYATNLFDLIKKTGIYSREFDSKFLLYKENIVNLLDSKTTYETKLITCDETLQSNRYSSRILSDSSTSNDSIINHLEINLKSNSSSGQKNQEDFFSKEELKKKKFNYEIKVEMPAKLEPKTIISSSFDSQSRSWKLIIDIDDSTNISCYLLECGNPSYTNAKKQFITEFTAVKYLIQIKDGPRDIENNLFYNFANNHNYCIGQKNICKFSDFVCKEVLEIRIWITEIPLFSSSIQYLSTRFNDLLKQLFQSGEKSNLITLDKSEKEFLGSKFNDLNLPKINFRRTIDQKIAKDERRKKSMSSLEVNFFRRQATLTNNESSSNNTLQVPQPNEECKMGSFSSSPDGASLSKICPYIFYYLLSSDNLTIEHEKFLAYFLYMVPKDHFDQRVKLLISGIRFSYIELSKLFDLARDIPYLKSDPFFISKLDFEVSQRMKSNTQFEKRRRFYHDELYKNWDFKKDLMKWLIDSDHHQNYKLKVDDLNKVIKEKDDQLKNQEKKFKTINQKVMLEARQNYLTDKIKDKAQELKKAEKMEVIESMPKNEIVSIDESKNNFIGKVKEMCNIY